MRDLSVVFVSLFLAAVAIAQAPQPKAPSRGTATSSSARPDGHLANVMRGILFPNANLLFDVQYTDPGAPLKSRAMPVPGASTSETFAGMYTGWEVVENAAVALEEAADVMLRPGRLCEGGKPVPVQRADFRKAAQNLRQVAKKSLKAAREKNRDTLINLANDLSDACLMCHEKYRDVGPPGSPLRCTVPPPKPDAIVDTETPRLR